MATAAAAIPLDYVAATRSFYDQLRSLRIGTLKWGGGLAELREWLTQAAGDPFENWKTIYRSELRTLLMSAMRDLGAREDSPIWQQATNTHYYERVLPGFISSYLFWIWEERVPLADSDQSAMVTAMLEGVAGYRLIDLHLDGESIGPEAVVLGNHLVRGYEVRLRAVFGERAAGPILDRYAKMFAEVEFREKSHRWKPCPFSWDNPAVIGWKVAPLTAVLHLLMDRAGRLASHIEVVSNALTQMLAALQMIDDQCDAVSDLTNGIETLAASGFYSWNGDAAVTESRVKEFLDQARMRRCLAGTLELINSALQGLEAADEPILVFNGELIKQRFLQRLAVGKREHAAAEG